MPRPWSSISAGLSHILLYPGVTGRLTPYVRLDVSDPDMRYFDLREATIRAGRGDHLWQAGMETLTGA